MERGSERSGEFALIDAFLQPFGLGRDGRAGAGPGIADIPGSASGAGSGVIVGPGDDCAQLLPSRGQVLVATTDAVLDGVHFDLRRCTPEDAGWKALAVNLSDLAAAGARPRWFLCALGVPKRALQRASATSPRVAKFANPARAGGGQDALRIARRLGAGMAALAAQAGCALAGGNVTSALQWTLTLTALGEARRPLSRAGGRPGDLLVLAGTLGAAALGLRLLQRRRRPSGASERAAVAAQLRPKPLVAAGLAAATLASAAIDVSDGLLKDLGQLCARSGCGAVIDCSALPRLASVVLAEAGDAQRGTHPYALSLGGGEEYALLLAVAPARLGRLLSALAAAGSPGTPIGRLEAKRGVRLTDGTRALPLPLRAGFDHLA